MPKRSRNASSFCTRNVLFSPGVKACWPNRRRLSAIVSRHLSRRFPIAGNTNSIQSSPVPNATRSWPAMTVAKSGSGVTRTRVSSRRFFWHEYRGCIAQNMESNRSLFLRWSQIADSPLLLRRKSTARSCRSNDEPVAIGTLRTSKKTNLFYCGGLELYPR